MAADGARTCILTGSPEHRAATADHGFKDTGCKERRENQALPMAPGGRIVRYTTRVMRIATALRITGELEMHASAGVSA